MSQGNYIFHPISSGESTLNSNPNITQWKPEGVSSIFTPKIMIHGSKYSYNPKINMMNSNINITNASYVTLTLPLPNTNHNR